MPGFDDDDEYESFDLDDTAPELDQAEVGATRVPRSAGPGDAGPAVGDDTEDEDEDDEDEDEDDDDLEDATLDEIDYVLAVHREDNQLHVQTLADDLANDLDELIVQLRRLPGDAGALGFVSLVEEVFVLVRVRGQHVQAVLSDSAAANDWPIARDVADFLGEDVDDDEDDGDPMGDLGMLTDLGLSEFELVALIEDLDLSSDQMLQAIAGRIGLNPQFARVADAAFDA